MIPICDICGGSLHAAGSDLACSRCGNLSSHAPSNMIDALRETLRPVAEQIANRYGPAIQRGFWADTDELGIVLTAGQCRAIIEAMGQPESQP